MSYKLTAHDNVIFLKVVFLIIIIILGQEGVKLEWERLSCLTNDCTVKKQQGKNSGCFPPLRSQKMLYGIIKRFSNQMHGQYAPEFEMRYPIFPLSILLFYRNLAVFMPDYIPVFK